MATALRWLLAIAPCALLAAQARAPFSGTVRDDAGKPLANAEVTCVFVPDFAMPGAPDHVACKTDGEGRFTAQLVAGNGYVVWAIGPPDQTLVRSVVRPCPDAAGGRQLDLTADERRGPTKLKVTGSTAWVADGPLSLRIIVGGRSVLGPDLVIPGDGLVTLPPLPVGQVGIALLDGKGQPIQICTCDLDADASLTFAEPRELPVLAQDADGKPLAGVQIVLQQIQASGPMPNRLGDPYPQHWPVCRLVGTTGADGKAAVRIAGEPGWLFGRMAGHSDCWSGWMRGLRMHDGKEAVDDGPLLFALRPVETRTLRLSAPASEPPLEVWFRSWTSFQFKNGVGSLQYWLPGSTTADGLRAVDGAPAGATVLAKVWYRDPTQLPRRIVGVSLGLGVQLPDLDLAGLRRMTVTVTDPEGRPVPCADIGVGDAKTPSRVIWQDRLVSDGGGRAELLLNGSTDWAVYATNGKASAVRVIATADLAGPLDLKLTPLANMRLCIVDEEDRPVRGATLHDSGGSFGSSAEDAEGKALDGIASMVNGPLLSLLRSNAAGEVEVWFLERKLVRTRFKVRAGKRESGDVLLRAGAEAQKVIVK